MPTGCTAKLVEKGQPFDEFVWTCARAFGALIMMRDDANDAPIPIEFKPSKYHAEKIADAKTELARFEKMTEPQRLAYGENQKMKAVKASAEYLERTVAENARITAMIEQVKAWEPPTEDHRGMKDFMLQQLTVSLSDVSWSTADLEKSKAKSPLDYFEAALKSRRDDLVYHPKQYQEEVERVAGRNKWLADLRKSVPIPAHMLASV